MEEVNQEWKTFLNKTVKIIYDDGERHPKLKQGKLLEANKTHLIIQVNDYPQAILRTRIIRVEVIK